jgi:hypothetical protein
MVKKGYRYTVVMLLLSSFVVIIASSLLVSASIDVDSDKGLYNLGDEIVASYDFTSDQDFNGLMKLSLVCSDFNLEFYTLPTKIFAGETQHVIVPPLSVAPAMRGNCSIDAKASSYGGSLNQNASSSQFDVTSSIPISVSVDKERYAPLESVEVSGEVDKSHNLQASVVMGFLGTKYVSPIVNGSFAYSIRLPENIKSGNHELAFFVNDSYGNSGAVSENFEAESIPTMISNKFSSQSVDPSEQFTVSVSLYDQAEDKITTSVNVQVKDSSGNVVLSVTNSTGKEVTLVFPASQSPGSYILTSTASGLSTESTLAVKEIQDVDVSFDGGKVVLQNTGNVNYVDAFKITLSGDRSYDIKNNIDLKPGEVFIVDLSKSVSTGTYDVDFPTVVNSSKTESVYVEDTRSVVKKSSDFVGITGRNIKSTTGSGIIQAKLAPILLLAIISVVGLYFIKNRRGGGIGLGGLSLKGNGKSSGDYREKDQFGSGEDDDDGDISSTEPVPTEKESEEDKVRRIIEEKHKNQSTGTETEPKSLREDPDSQKFVDNMLKDKPFR